MKTIYNKLRIKKEHMFMMVIFYKTRKVAFPATHFEKHIFSYLSKHNNNPNPSPIMKIWFGLSLSGAVKRT